MSLAHGQAGSFARVAIVLVIGTLVCACGGGGGGGDGGGGGGNGPRLSVNTTDVTLAVEPGDHNPARTVLLTITNAPAGGLTADVSTTTNGVISASAININTTQPRVDIVFEEPGKRLDGTYEDEVDVRVCTDAACNQQIAGSPVKIRTHYTVSGGRTATVSRDTVAVTLDTRDHSSVVIPVSVILDEAPEVGFYVTADDSPGAEIGAVIGADTSSVSDTQVDVEIRFFEGSSLPPGQYDDSVLIRVCYELTCFRQVEGSPFTVATHATVAVGAEDGVDPLPVLSRVALPHDVVDAEFSKALNAIVMVGTFPSNAIYVYDVATGLERSQALSKAPAAVSIAPDGLTAAVGHDALVSVFDLTVLGQVGAPAPTLADITSNTFDLVLDGRGVAHVFPAFGPSVAPHSVEISTNTEFLGTAVTGAGEHARLHPNGDWLFTANQGVSPNDIAKWDATTDGLTYLYDSPYHGDYDMCENVWPSENGETVYTACGHAFRSSATPSEDLIHTGAMALSSSGSNKWYARSLSETDADDDIVLVEARSSDCQPGGGNSPCYTHLATYDKATLARLSVFSISAVSIAGQDYAQQGLFVFRDVANGHKYVIGRLDDSPDPLQTYYLSVVE